MTVRPARALSGALGLLAGLLVTAAAAQTVPPHERDPTPSPGFLARFHYHLAMATLSGDDPLVQWDADFGGDFDLVDFGRGRVNVLFNYEAVLGEQFQPFDPVFANYTIGLLGGVRFGTVEVAAVFEHVSRHLSDRPKVFGIAWNGLGAEVSDRRRSGAWDVEGRLRLLGVVAASYVDYDAEVTADLVVRRRWRPRLSWLARGQGRWVATDRQRFGRSGMAAGLLEAGLRVLGERAALDVIAGVERRVDVDPIRLTPGSWAFLGVRVVDRPAVP